MRLTGTHVHSWYEYFSIGLLLRTMFSPWRQIIARPTNADPIQAKLSAVVDNIVSRCVGFSVRLFVIFAGIITIAFVVIVNLFIFILWPLLPLAPALLPIIGTMI